MQTHVQHLWGSEPLQAHLVGLPRQCPLETCEVKVRSKQRDLPRSSKQAFSIHKGFGGFPPIPPFPLGP